MGKKLGLLGFILLVVGCRKTGMVSTYEPDGEDGENPGSTSYTKTVLAPEFDEEGASSGQIGCPPRDITVRDIQYDRGMRTWTAFCGDKTYACTNAEDVTSCKPVSEDSDSNEPRKIVRSPRAPDHAPPKGAAGFQFGMSVDAAKQACETAGHGFEQADPASTCSGTPEAIGLPARARLGFCKSKLCEIELVAKPSSAESAAWIETFSKLASALEDKYGKSNVESRLLPKRCRETFAECLDKGEVEISYQWVWSRSVGVLLAVDRAPGEPAIRLQYLHRPQRKGPAVNIKKDAL